MSIKKIIGVIILAGVFWLLLLGVNSKEDLYKKEIKNNIQEYQEYKNNVMRFPIQIKSGEYNTIKHHIDALRFNDITANKEDIEKIFEKKYINEINTKYSEYIITNETSYICINFDDEMKFIEYPVNINDNYLKNIRTFMKEIEDDSVNVFPFNDGIYCLICTNKDNYIYNIELGKVLWNGGGYYEAPKVKIFNDTLETTGDLSNDIYIFNKYGDLIETQKNGW